MNWIYRDRLVRSAYTLAARFPRNSNVSAYLFRKRSAIHAGLR